MKLGFGIVAISFFLNALAHAESFKIPTQPVKSGVACNDANIDVVATASPESAAVKVIAYRKTKQFAVKASKVGNVVTYSAGGAKLDVDFDRVLPGSDAVLGELDVELDGERIRADIPCRLLFISAKHPTLSAWQ